MTVDAVAPSTRTQWSVHDRRRSGGPLLAGRCTVAVVDARRPMAVAAVPWRRSMLEPLHRGIFEPQPSLHARAAGIVADNFAQQAAHAARPRAVSMLLYLPVGRPRAVSSPWPRAVSMLLYLPVGELIREDWRLSAGSTQDLLIVSDRSSD